MNVHQLHLLHLFSKPSWRFCCFLYLVSLILKDYTLTNREPRLGHRWIKRKFSQYVSELYKHLVLILNLFLLKIIPSDDIQAHDNAQRKKVYLIYCTKDYFLRSLNEKHILKILFLEPTGQCPWDSIQPKHTYPIQWSNMILSFSHTECSTSSERCKKIVDGYFFVKFLMGLKHQHKLNLNYPVANFL